MVLFLVVFSLLVAIGFGVASAISDFKSMTIPNVYALGVVLALVPAFAADAFLSAEGIVFFSAFKSHIAAAIVVFIITFLLFTARIIGAGDSKLCSAFALWVGLQGLAAFLFYMAIVGALLGLTTKIMMGRKLFESPAAGSWIEKAQGGHAGVPYGIAILIGAIVAFYQLGYFSPEKLALLAGYTENQP